MSKNGILWKKKTKKKSNAVFLACVFLGFAFEVVAIVCVLVLNSLLSHQSNDYVSGFSYDVSSYVAQYLMFVENLRLGCRRLDCGRVCCQVVSLPAKRLKER